jgi:hypothetical protein
MTIIQKYYNNGVNTEWTRMDRHPLEFEITKRNLDESIPPKSKIADKLLILVVAQGSILFILHHKDIMSHL